MRAIGNTAIFVIAYIILMIPTYVLPYFGSNSAIVGALSAALGLGPTPQWWMHMWCLATLIILAWMRGSYAGRAYLPIFPILATVFDLTPVINNIPLVPTTMHLLAIILGVMSKEPAVEADICRTARRTLVTFIGITGLSIAGIALFVSSSVLRSKLDKPLDRSTGQTKPAATSVSAVQETSTSAPNVTSTTIVLATPTTVIQATPTTVIQATSTTVISRPAAQVSTPARVQKGQTQEKSSTNIPNSVPLSHSRQPASESVSGAAQMPSNSGAINGMLDDGESCFAKKKYDCAITDAKSALLIDPSNARALALKQRAEAESKRAMESITIN